MNSSDARAALNALFEQPIAREVVLEVPEIKVPANLDAVIRLDNAAVWDHLVYYWYTGQDAQGIQHVFRFQRGRSVDDWHITLKTQKLASVQGPYRNQIQAQRAA